LFLYNTKNLHYRYNLLLSIDIVRLFFAQEFNVLYSELIFVNFKHISPPTFPTPPKMAFSRAAILRNLRNFRARPTAARPQLVNQIAKRTYASHGGHETAKAGGDAVWAAGAVAVTLPTCYFLLQNRPDTSSHGHGAHGAHGDSHGKEHAKEHEEEHKEEPTEEPAQEESKDEEKSESEEKPEAEEKSGEKSEEKEGSYFSGNDDRYKESAISGPSHDESVVSADEKNVRKSYPDAKGGNKARIESQRGHKQGLKDPVGAEDEPLDRPAASKEPLGKNTTSAKQEGLSNTDTKHSGDITNDKNKSSKGEGSVETAKVKGTVDPKRPQV